MEDEETVEEALELDPDPEGLDDEELQDALRGDSGEEVEADQRKARRRTAALAGRSALGGEVGEGGDGYQQSLRLRTPAAEGLQRRQSQEIYTWEACARVVTKERADFFEFVVSGRRDYVWEHSLTRFEPVFSSATSSSRPFL